MTATTGRAKTYAAIAGLLILALTFAALGAWQLQRAAASRATRQQFAAESTVAVLPRTLTDAERFHRVVVRGEYVAAPQFLLDNMLHAGEAGYQVLTVLRLPNTDERLLVNRGWVPTRGDRRVLPDVAVAGGIRMITGRLERLPRPGLRLGNPAAVTGPQADVVVLQYPTAVELAKRLGEPVFDYQVLLDEGEPAGYVRDWQAPGLDPQRHLGYTGQWWALAIGGLAAAVVMAYRTVRRRS